MNVGGFVVTKKAVMKMKLQLSLKLTSQNQSNTRRLIIKNRSVTLTVVVVQKKKTSMLTLILTNQFTWPLINFLFLKQESKGINKTY